MSEESQQFSDSDDDIESSVQNTWLVRLGSPYFKWEKYVWIDKDSCAIHNSIIKFLTNVEIDNNSQNNHGKRTLEHLIDFIVANRKEAINEKKEDKKGVKAKKPCKYHADNETDPPLNYTEEFMALVTESAPPGYGFYGVGFYCKPEKPKKSAKFGNIEIQYKRIPESSYGTVLTYCSSEALVDRRIGINIHLNPGQGHSHQSFDSDFNIIFQAFRNIKDKAKLRQFEELGVENLSAVSGKKFSPLPDWVESYNEYKAAKAKKSGLGAIEPVSPQPTKKHEDKKHVEGSKKSSKSLYDDKIKECYEFLGNIADDDAYRDRVDVLRKKDSPMEEDFIQLEELYTELRKASEKYEQDLLKGCGSGPSSPTY